MHRPIGFHDLRSTTATLLARAGAPLVVAQAPELIRYAASHADTAIIGCLTVEEVRANLAVAHRFVAMTPQELVDLEARLEPMASSYDDYKRG